MYIPAAIIIAITVTLLSIGVWIIAMERNKTFPDEIEPAKIFIGILLGGGAILFAFFSLFTTMWINTFS